MSFCPDSKITVKQKEGVLAFHTDSSGALCQVDSEQGISSVITTGPSPKLQTIQTTLQTSPWNGIQCSMHPHTWFIKPVCTRSGFHMACRLPESPVSPHSPDSPCQPYILTQSTSTFRCPPSQGAGPALWSLTALPQSLLLGTQSLPNPTEQGVSNN